MVEGATYDISLVKRNMAGMRTGAKKVERYVYMQE